MNASCLVFMLTLLLLCFLPLKLMYSDKGFRFSYDVPDLDADLERVPLHLHIIYSWDEHMYYILTIEVILLTYSIKMFPFLVQFSGFDLLPCDLLLSINCVDCLYLGVL